MTASWNCSLLLHFSPKKVSPSSNEHCDGNANMCSRAIMGSSDLGIWTIYQLCMHLTKLQTPFWTWRLSIFSMFFFLYVGFEMPKLLTQEDCWLQCSATENLIVYCSRQKKTGSDHENWFVREKVTWLQNVLHLPPQMSPHKGTRRLQRAGVDLFGDSSDFHQLTLSGAAYRRLMSPGNMPERPREETILQLAETQGSLKHTGDSMLGSP